MRTSRLAGFALITMLVLSQGGCWGENNDKAAAGNTTAVDVSALPTTGLKPDASEPAVSDEESGNPPSAQPTRTTPTAAKTVDATQGQGNSGAVLSTAITTIDCGDLPVSGFYTESKTGSNKPPFGDVDLGNNNQAKVVKVTHSIDASTGQFRPNIGCGYVAGGDNDWKYEFNLKPISGGFSTIKCTHTDCTVNGKKAALRN